MYKSFVGIDISGNTAKAVLIKKGFRKTRFMRAFSTKLLRENQTSLSDFKRLIIEEFISQGVQVIAGIKETPLSVKVLKFPFTDTNKVEQVYKFEIENVSTFDTKDKQMDYQLLELDEGAEAMISIFHKDTFERYLKNLSEIDLDPRYITVTPFAFSSINEFLPKERPIFLINMDSDNLSFALFDDFGLRRVRNSNDTVDRIKKFFGTSDLNFEKIDEDDELKTKFIESLFSLVDEIRRTTHYFETEIKRPINNFFITGDICNIGDVEQYLGGKLYCEIKKVLIPDMDLKDSSFFFNAYCLAKYGCDFSKKSFNLRKGEYVYKGKSYDLKKTFAFPLALASVLFLLLIFKNTTSYFSTAGEIKSINSQIKKEIESSFSNIGTVPDPVLFLEQEIKKVQDNLEFLRDIKGSSTPLNILRDISISISEDQRVSLDQISIEADKKIMLWGKCSSYKEVALIEKSLINSGKFKDVERGQVNTTVNDTIKFVFSMSFK